MTDQVDGGLASKGKRRRLTNSQLRLLGFVAACGADGCSETKQALAAKLQISLKTVDRAIHRLREEGLIVSHARFGEDGTQLGNTYIATAMDGEIDQQDSQSKQE
ncbi:HTH domain-containing protein [uncultured Senegalimassilia sp.]|uniref:HTH domain-containing protein n=1 Tax=uncultured Senegalimassilia sp. TaxID=1714350 RepID=UPI0027DDC916|nr:HTH domain-containing protein [uncultured Senegalimassilia sp.]